MSGRTWYTSDLHFGHLKAALWRGFDTAAEHDATLVNNWNDEVHEDDTVWVLGDVALSSSGLSTVSLLKGRKHLVLGNHDGPFPQNRGAARAQRKYLKYFDSVQLHARRKVGGTEFLLSHMPYSGDRGEDRYTQWRLRDEGLPLVHGHLHTPEYFTGPRQIHVGVDAWGLHPVPQEIVLDLVRHATGTEGSVLAR